MTRPMIREIQQAVCDHYGLPLREMESRTRKSARKRQVAMFLARRMTTLSYPQIGRLFGSKDHTTIMYGERLIDAQRRADRDLARAITSIGQRAAHLASHRREQA
jgi:chromosomal replication initiator protein